MRTATIGFRAKTARAIAIALHANDGGPEYVARWEVVLHDPKVAATSQPHHEVMELPWAEAQSSVRPLERRIEAVAIEMLSGLLKDAAARGFHVLGVGVVGSPDRPLDRIGNSHIRAHAAEGILFRRVLEIAAIENKLQYRSFSDKRFDELVFPQLRRTRGEIQNTLRAIGRAAGRPWRADERAAAVAAWLLL